MTDTLTVHQAIAKVMNDLPAIGKDAKSPEGYSYRGIEAITKHLQPLMARHGLVIIPSATITNVVPSPAMKEGWQDVYMSVDWTIVGPDGSTFSARTSGIGRDRADKGANKAQTQAFKYLLLNMLMIADKADDTDGATYDEHVSSKPQRQQRQAPPPAAPTVPPDPNLITPAQLKALHASFNGIGITDRDERLAFVVAAIGEPIESSKNLTKAQTEVVFNAIAAAAPKEPQP